MGASKTVTLTMQDAADIALALVLAANAGVIPVERAYALVDMIYVAHVAMINDTMNGEPGGD
jgi:hypothetical protein